MSVVAFGCAACGRSGVPAVLKPGLGRELFRLGCVAVDA